jgi:small subunit ribosomal protein S17e
MRMSQLQKGRLQPVNSPLIFLSPLPLPLPPCPLCPVCVSARVRLTLDFDTNKKIAEEVAVIPSKRVRNKIAGFITHLMKRIQRGGSVRGISLKLQEEERERRLDFLPERSALDLDVVDVDEDTFDLLRSLEFEDIPGIHRVAQQQQMGGGQGGLGAGGRGGQGGQRGGRGGGRGGQGGDRKPREGDRKPRAEPGRKETATVTPA